MSPSVRLSLAYAAIFGVFGLAQPYAPLWFADRGVTVEQLGWLTAVTMVTKLVTTGPIGNLADRTGRPALIATILMTGVTLVHAGYIVGDGFIVYLVLAALNGMLTPAALGLVDSVAIAETTRTGVAYGRVRLWGSVSFLALNLIGGWVLELAPVAVIMPMIVACFVASTLSVALLPRPPADAPKPPRASLWVHGATVLRAPGMAWMFLAAGLIQASHAIYYLYGAIHWQGVGLETSVIGSLWAEAVTAEVVLMAFAAAFFRRFDPIQALMLAGVLCAVRWVGMALTTDVIALAGLQALHGITFGAAHLAALRLVADRAPSGLAATAQGLYAALPMGLGAALAYAASGALWTHLQADAYHLMAAIGLLGGAVAWAIDRGGKD